MKRLISKKIVQIPLLIVYIGIIGWFFLSHLIAHSINGVDPSHIVVCPTPKTTRRITIDSTGFHPQKSILYLCEKVEFLNTDKKFHYVAFGEHEHHLVYPGYKEGLLKAGKSVTFTLTAYGTYKIHDHIYDELQGQLQILQ